MVVTHDHVHLSQKSMMMVNIVEALKDQKEINLLPIMDMTDQDSR